MANTIRVTKSNIAVLETDAPVGDTTLRMTKISFVTITGVTDENPAPPTGRSQVIII